MNTKRVSKFLSLVLRHKPETIGITLDENGWVSVEELLEAMHKNGKQITIEQLEDVVKNNDKKRFIIEDSRIRANQGHSLNVDLKLTTAVPPKILHHGTATRFLKPILEEGLRKMNRQHVHLSNDEVTASKVGARHGKLVILAITAGKMHSDGYKFYCSENGVWLTNSVPNDYITTLEGA